MSTVEQVKRIRIEDVTFPRLLFELLRKRFTGVVELDQPAPHAGRRKIWLNGGMPVFTDWVSPPDVLGAVLVDLRKISQDQLEGALAEMAAGNKLLGDVLRDRSFLDEPQITEGLRAQCERKLVHAFELREGEATLTPGTDVATLPDVGQINTLAVILRGIGRHYEELDVARVMGAKLARPIAASEAFRNYAARFGFRTQDKLALHALIEGSTVEELAELPDTSRARAAQLAFALWCCDMLETGDPAKQRWDVARARRKAAKAADEPSAASSIETGVPQAILHDRSSGVIELEVSRIERRMTDGGSVRELLGVSAATTNDEVDKRLRKMTRALGGSKVPPALKRRAARVVDALQEARAQQSGVFRVADASKSGARALAAESARDEAHGLLRQADKLLQSGKIDRALERYRTAAALHGDLPEASAQVIWCHVVLDNKSHEALKQAAAAITQLLEKHPECGRALYVRGLVWREQGKRGQARESFVAAFRHDPKLTDAKRQAHILGKGGAQR